MFVSVKVMNKKKNLLNELRMSSQLFKIILRTVLLERAKLFRFNIFKRMNFALTRTTRHLQSHKRPQEVSANNFCDDPASNDKQG